MQQLVSILIPCYNAEKYVVMAVESALGQTWPKTEIIVVDDGSKDRSLELVKKCATRGVQIIAQSNRGAAAARNTALRASSGAYVQYLDADDLLSPDKIERQMTLLQQCESGCMASCAWGVFTNSPSQATFNPEPVWDDFSPVEWLVRSWEGGGMMQPGTWLTPRAVAQAAGHWNESLSLDDDGEYFTRVLLCSRGVKFAQDAKVFYRRHSGPRLSAMTGPNAARSAFAACTLKQQHLLAAENSSRTRQACATAFQRFIFDVYPDVPNLVRQAETLVRELGGTKLKMHGSQKLNFAVSLLGWKMVKRIQRMRRHHQRYEKGVFCKDEPFL
jgi:glycosyltransferase involved in cell wall biosynthesis